MRKFIISPRLAAAVLPPPPPLAVPSPPPSLPAVVKACGSGDISPTQSPFTTFGSFDCRGFFGGNLINGSPTDKALQLIALNQMGFGGTAATFNFDSFEKLDPLGGSQTINFSQLLNGTTYIGLHFGAGKGTDHPVGQEASVFYKFDAGTNLDKFYLFYNASSNAVLYKTGTPPPPPVVPGPATWAMMLAGFGTVGYAMRRRRSVAVSFA